MPVSRALSVWLPVVVWAAVIFTFSSISGLSTGLGTWDLMLRKAAHMTEYAILGALLVRALGRDTAILGERARIERRDRAEAPRRVLEPVSPERPGVPEHAVQLDRHRPHWACLASDTGRVCQRRSR